MALVDYSSDSSAESEIASADAARSKRQKTSHGEQLPPLPSAFHDLYASTVRVSASDDPALHQGRKRVNPHKVGNWPSHVYIEWHPTQAERTTLMTLLSNLQTSLASLQTPPLSITSFLTSDLGAPQPLHISLSRPIVLSTSQKEPFHTRLASSIRESDVTPFELAAEGVEWHRTDESARSFLVLRVRAMAANADDEKKAKDPEPTPAPRNPHLATLLDRANAVVTSFGQPALYARTDSDVDRAFHVSIAWSFAAPTDELRRVTEAAFAATEAMRLRVDGVKIKIGNVVTHVPLPEAKGRKMVGDREAGRGLFGLV